jgi:hypothetical protein
MPTNILQIMANAGADPAGPRLLASEAFNAGLKRFDDGRTLVYMPARRIGKTALQIAVHGPNYRGPTLGEPEGPKMPQKA